MREAGVVKKICLNCHFCDVAYPDESILEVELEEDYLICLQTNKKTDDYETCKNWQKCKGREADLKMGC